MTAPATQRHPQFARSDAHLREDSEPPKRWLEDQWFEVARRALAEMLAVDTRMRNEMIQFLLDEGFWDARRLGWDGAVTRFNACLNPNKRDAYFKISEIWALAKRFDRPQLFLSIMDDLGYETRPIPTEARRQELLLRIARATEECAQAVAAASAELSRLPAHGDDARPAQETGHSRAAFSRADIAI